MPAALEEHRRLAALAHVRLHSGDVDGAVELLAAAREGALRLDRHLFAARCTITTGTALRESGHYPEARAAYADAAVALHDIARAERGDVVAAEADLRSELGLLNLDLGAYDRAEALLLEARARFARLGREVSGARCTLNLGLVYRVTGRFHAARTALGAARDALLEGGHPMEAAEATMHLGVLNIAVGDYRCARRDLRNARLVFRARGQSLRAARCDLYLGNLALETGALESARRRYTAARAAFLAEGRRRLASDCTMNLGLIHLVADEFEEADAALREALHAYRDLGLHHEEADCTVNIGTIHHQRGDQAMAVAAYREARAAYERLELPVDAAHCSLNLGIAYRGAGDWEDALRELAVARALFVDLGLPRDQAWCDLAAGRTLIGQARARGRTPSTATMRGVLDLWVPALLYLDSARFQLPTAAERRDWRARVAGWYADVFTLAAALGDAELVADLVDTAVNAAHYPVTGTAEVPDAEARGARRPPRRHGYVETHRLVLAEANPLLTGTTLPIAPPPRLRSAYDHPVLRSAWDAVADRYSPDAAPSPDWLLDTW